jgi:hypothetical protein
MQQNNFHEKHFNPVTTNNVVAGTDKLTRIGTERYLKGKQVTGR